MKKKRWLILFAALALLCAACGKVQTKEEEEPPAGAADTAFPAGPAQEGAEAAPPEQVAQKSGLYDPSIFVIEASGSWRQELAPGYFADYSCELYLDKTDADDNRSAAGLYTGVCWMKTTVDAGEFLTEFLADAPVEMDFSAGGEGICDNLTMHLLDGYVRDPFGDYGIPDGQGGFTAPEKEALAGEGGFIAVGRQAYLDAQARGVGGEQLTHQDGQSGDAEIRYVIQVAPDPGKTASERRAVIYLSDAAGMAVTLEGTWRRLPGAPEDRLAYANENRSGQLLERHLGQ
ncbi:MAG: hypothetical protein GXX99_03660 [Clostridiales bacterium]|nr:hypothetical protein [Clostridiales bacterium]